MHYVWSMKRQRGGVTKRAATMPRASALTESPYQSAAHELNERIEDIDDSIDIVGLQSAVEELVTDAEALRDEQQERLDNMPEGLQQGSTGQLLQDRVEQLDAFIDELQAIDLDEWEAEPFTPEDERNEAGEEVDENGNTRDEYDEEPLNSEGLSEADYTASKLEEDPRSQPRRRLGEQVLVLPSYRAGPRPRRRCGRGLTVPDHAALAGHPLPDGVEDVLGPGPAQRSLGQLAEHVIRHPDGDYFGRHIVSLLQVVEVLACHIDYVTRLDKFVV